MSVRLNARLSQIASYIRKGDSVCDVGTDHGFLPIWIKENELSDKVIMSDVSRGSLDKAVRDAEEELEQVDMPDARLGDGLDVLEPGEVDDIVIAGMGGIQIIDILSWDISKTLTYRKFILQPRRDSALLRKWLSVNGFTITDQTIVPENGRYSEIICCTSEGASAEDIGLADRCTVQDLFDKDPDGWMELEYPDGLRDPSGQGIDRKYYLSELEKTDYIIGNIKANSDAGSDMLRLLNKRKERLEKLCGKKTS